MHAILRILFTKMIASMCIFGSYAGNERIVGQGSDLGQPDELEQYEVGTLDVQAYPDTEQDDHDPEQDGFYLRYRLRMYWA